VQTDFAIMEFSPEPESRSHNKNCRKRGKVALARP
jgi:hypothetical protein